MSENKPPITHTFSKEGHIILPFTGDQFGEFVKNLLGSPQRITRMYKGSFTLDREQLASFHKVIKQRIEQQNDTSLFHFTAEIFFSDNSSVKTGSFEEFISYNEIRPVICVGVEMTWDCLIRFQDKDVPEKQTINLVFHTAAGLRHDILFDRSPYLPFSQSSGVITLRASHTARTWGMDIESTVSHQVETVMDHWPKWKALLVTKSDRIGLIVATMVVSASFVGVFYSAKREAAYRLAEISTFNDNVQQQVLAIHHYIVSGAWPTFYFGAASFVIASSVFALFIGTWISSALTNYPPSFILLTSASDRHRITSLRQYRKRWISFGLSIAFAILTGVAGNLVFYWIMK